MRRGAMNAIGVLPKRPCLECRRHAKRLRPVVLRDPQETVAKTRIGRGHAAELLLDEMTRIEAGPTSHNFLDMFNELARLIERHGGAGQVSLVIEHQQRAAARLDRVEKKVRLVRTVTTHPEVIGAP